MTNRLNTEMDSKKRPQINFPESVVCSLEQLIALRGRNSRPIFGERRSGSMLMGAHRSQFRGRGMDFEEVRRYQAGDDIRHIDWRVTARTGETHTKLFREERERPLHLLVDQSHSLFFGSQRQFKSVAAARLAALIAWQGFQQRDRVGGVVFNEYGIDELKPISGKRGTLQFIHALAKKNREVAEFTLREQQGAQPPKPLTTPSSKQSHPLLTALHHLHSTVKPGSFVYLISDFKEIEQKKMGGGETFESLLSQIHRHNDLVAIMVYDPAERTLPGRGVLGISDGLHKRRLDANNQRIKREHSARFLKHETHVRTLFSDYGIPTLTCSTANEIDAQWLSLNLSAQAKSGHSAASANKE